MPSHSLHLSDLLASSCGRYKFASQNARPPKKNITVVPAQYDLVFFLVLLSQERKKYTTSPKHNTELLGYGQLGPSFCSSGSVLLLLLYCSSTPPLLQLTAQSPPCRRPSPQQICLLQICLRRLDAYPTYRLADRLGRSSALLSFGYDSQYFGISHIVVFVLC